MNLWIPAAVYLSPLLQCMALTFLWVYGDAQLVTLQQMKFLKENPALSGGGTAPNEPTCRKQRTRVSNEMLFFAPTIERGTQLTVPGRYSSARNGTGGSSKEDPRFRRHRNHHSCRSKRTAYRQLAPRSLSTSSPSPSSSSQALPSFSLPISTSSFSSLFPPSSSSLVSAKKGEKTGEVSQPSVNTSGTPSDTHDAVFLGSIHMDSYQRIINASISNPGSTSSPGRVSATDPYIDPATPTHVTGYTGVTAILSCFVNNLGQRSVSWVRNRDIHVLTVGRFTFTNDDRFFSHHDDGSNEWALRLRSPKTEDSGYYECQVNTKPILKRLIFLQVLEPHAVVYSVQELYVKLGSTVELKCSVINAPSKPDFLLWYHDEKVMNYEKGRVIINISEEENDTGSILRITSATGKDSGTYTCSPSNAKNASVNLHIINGEHPAAMQTNCGKIVVCHFGFLTLALFIGPCLMIKMPDIAILMIFRQKVTQKGS